MKTNIYFWSYLTQFFLELEIFKTKFVEKVKTHIYVQRSGCVVMRFLCKNGCMNAPQVLRYTHTACLV
jgi:hypothetical protein